MTGIIAAIKMTIRRFSALMANAQNMIRNPFTHAGIKYKILTDKF
jgi:hypothetical protein